MPKRKLSQIEAKVYAVWIMLKEVRKESEKKEKEREERRAMLILLPGGKKD